MTHNANIANPGTTESRLRWLRTPQFWLAMLLLLLGGVGLFFTTWHWKMPTAAVVVAARDLPAYRRIAPTDITTQTLPLADVSAVMTVSGDVLGRFVTAPLAKGETIPKAKLLDAPQVGNDWWILSAPITSTADPVPGETVLLVGVDEDGDSAQISAKAVTLGIEGDNAVIALPLEEGLVAAGYLGNERRLLVIRVTS